MTNGPRARGKKSKELVLLKDLVPRKDPKGGASSKSVFGDVIVVPEPPEPSAPPEAPVKKKR